MNYSDQFKDTGYNGPDFDIEENLPRFDCGHRGYEEESLELEDGRVICVNCAAILGEQNTDPTGVSTDRETGRD